jgi:nucleoid-associated protein YgaU
MRTHTSRNVLRLAGSALVGVALLLAAGCGSKVTRDVEVSNGEYYSADEVKKLDKDDYKSYCAQLDAELARLQTAASSSKSEAEQARASVAQLQAEVRDLESRYGAAKADVEQVEKEIAYYEGLPKSWTVRDGEFLHKIAGYEEIYADPLKWPRLYRANRERIADPNLIYPGWVLTVPRDWPNQWTVASGEYLSRIAGYWEVYNQPTAWPRLYEANKDQVSDPEVVRPGWVLTIPRESAATTTSMEGK